jgi:hypothetical protein
MRPSWIAGRARFNAPDLKSDVRSNVPGVRIPRYPPYYRETAYLAVFFCLQFHLHLIPLTGFYILTFTFGQV